MESAREAINWASYRRFINRLAHERRKRELEAQSERGLGDCESERGDRLSEDKIVLGYAMLEGGGQIFRRVQLMADISRWSAESHGEERIREALAIFSKESTHAWPYGFTGEPRVAGEDGVVQYLRGHHVLELTPHFSDGSNTLEIANKFDASHHASLINDGRLFLVVDARANDAQIKKSLVNLLRQARIDFNIKGGSIPSVGEKQKSLYTLEEVLAVWDWKLFNHHGLDSTKFSELARVVLGEPDGETAAKRLRSVSKDNEEEMLTFDYAVHLQRQGFR